MPHATLATERRTFGRTDLDVSPLGFGGAPIGVLDSGHKQTTAVLNLLLDQGANLIDTAACYYGSEEGIGNAVAGRRDEFVLVSKCGHTVEKDDPRTNFSSEVIRESIDRSLTRLQTDRLDVILIHSCSLDVLKEGSAIDAVVEARDAGKVRHVGYSGDNEAAAWACVHPEIAVLQTSISICDQANIESALPLAIRNNVGVMAKRPIANAAWKTQSQQYERYYNYAKPYHERFEAMGLTHEMLGEFDFDLSRREGDLWAEVALRFTLSIEGVHVAIVGTTQREHVLSNLEYASRGRLAEELVEAIRKKFRTANDGSWKGLT